MATQFKTVTPHEAYSRTKLFVKKMQVHANGLQHPGHMEWTQDGRLLVSEFGRGRIVDITEGGDLRDATPFAYGLEHPAAIITNYEGNKIIAVDTGNNCVVDITSGGDVSKNERVISNIPAPYGMTLFKDELYVTYTSYEDNGLMKASNTKSFSLEAAQASSFPVGVSEHPYFLAGSAGCGHWTAAVMGEKLIFSQTTFGILWDVTNQGKFSLDTHTRFAWGLNKPVGMIYNEKLNLLFVTESGSGSIKTIPSEGGIDMRFVPPVVVGLKEPRCVRFTPDGLTMFACDMASCCIWRIEFEVY